MLTCNSNGALSEKEVIEICIIYEYSDKSWSIMSRKENKCREKNHLSDNYTKDHPAIGEGEQLKCLLLD